MEKVAFKCLDCGVINIYNNGMDGKRCMECNSAIVPIGVARVCSESSRTSIGEVVANIKIDTTEIDYTIGKLREITKLTNEIKRELDLDIKISHRNRMTPPILSI